MSNTLIMCRICIFAYFPKYSQHLFGCKKNTNFAPWFTSGGIVFHVWKTQFMLDLYCQAKTLRLGDTL